MEERPAPADTPAGMTRRTVLKFAAAGALGAAVGAGSTAAIVRLGQAAPSKYRSFSEEEAAMLIAMCEQIIPRDDTPGATDAGVIHYIDRQLASALSRHQRTYHAGLASFRNTCLKVYQKPFEQLAWEKQTEALKLIESGKAPKELWSGEPTQQAFFNLVIEHTMQGFYGSPRHGGNRDYVSYRMLGLAYPNIIGQNRYRDLNRG